MRRWLVFDQRNNVGLSLANVDTLEQQQLSQGDVVQLDAVNSFVVGLLVFLSVFLGELGLNGECMVSSGALEEDKVVCGYL